MADVSRLHTFNNELGQFHGHVASVNDQLKGMREVVIQAERVADAAEDAARTVARVQDVVDDLRVTAKALGAFGALKPVANAVVRALDSVDRVADRVHDKLVEIDRRIDNTKIPEKLDKIHVRLNTYIGKFDKVEGGVESVMDATDSTEDVIGVMAQLPFGDKGVGLARFASSVVDTPTSVLIVVNDGIDTVKREVSQAIDSLGLPDIGPVLQVRTAMEKVLAAFKPVTGPLHQVANIFKPLADLSDFLYKITIGPLVDWALDELNVDSVVASMEKKILAALPGVSVLDGAVAAIDQLARSLDEMVGDADPLGVDRWLADAEARVLGPLQQSTDKHLQIGQAASETLTGTNDADALHGGAGHDTLRGQAGDDMLVGGPGNDVIDGGAGSDVVVLAGSAGDYGFETDAAGFTTITQLRTVAGRVSDGVDRITAVETAVFNDARIAVDQLSTLVRTAGNATTLNGSDAGEFLFGGSKALTINAGAGDDMLKGSPLNDTLYGEAGDDLFVYSGGDDRFSGSTGADSFRLPQQTGAFSARFVMADLFGTNITLLSANGTQINRSTTSSVASASIEHPVATAFYGNSDVNRFTGSDKPDLAIGLDGSDEFDGGEGDDVLIGGDGGYVLSGPERGDVLRGGDGNDLLVAGNSPADRYGDVYDGGSGTDTLNYTASLNTPINVWLQSLGDAGTPAPSVVSDLAFTRRPLVTAGGWVEVQIGTDRVVRHATDGAVLATDTVSGIEHYVGSDGNDRYTGADGVDVTLEGGSGNDYFVPGIGNHLLGGPGNDTVDLRRSDDLVWYAQLVASDYGVGALNAYRPDATRDVDGGIDIERNELIGLGRIDEMEQVVGGNGDDFYRMLTARNITVGGGTGDDHFDVLGPANGGTNYTVNGEDGHDTFSLSEAGGRFSGGAGDDRFELYDATNATVSGDVGDDVVLLMAGKATLSGGDGQDLLQFIDLDSTVGVSVDLVSGTFSRAGTRALSGQLSGFETVIGQDKAPDTLLGSQGGDVLIGGGGHDLIGGRAGRDALYGGAGNDSLGAGDGDDLVHGGAGNDTLVGGAGVDVASWAFEQPGPDEGAPITQPAFTVQVDLATGRAIERINGATVGTDQLSAIENLIGGGLGDTLSGDDGPNLLDGGAGDDLLEGRGGADLLLLDGNDTALGGEGDDRIVVGSGRPVIDGGNGLDTLDFSGIGDFVEVDLTARTYRSGSAAEVGFAGIESVIGGAGGLRLLGTAQADRVGEGGGHGGSVVLWGLAGDDTLTGGAGDDVLNGGLGSDTLDGGAGRDLADYADAPLRIVVSLADGTGRAPDFNADVDRLVAIEDVRSGAGNDELAGNELANLLNSGGGDDRLHGAGGNDTLQGGDGIDTASYARARVDYGVSRAGDARMVQARAGGEGLDSLTGVERLQFADGALAFDLDGHAGLTVGLLVAVFGAGSVNNAVYAGIGIRWLDDGQTPLQVAGAAIGARLGTGASHADVVDTLFTNVVGRAPEAAERQVFVDLLDSGQHSPATLTLLAATHELVGQRVDLVGLADQGLPFIPA